MDTAIVLPCTTDTRVLLTHSDGREAEYQVVAWAADYAAFPTVLRPMFAHGGVATVAESNGEYEVKILGPR